MPLKKCLNLNITTHGLYSNSLEEATNHEGTQGCISVAITHTQGACDSFNTPYFVQNELLQKKSLQYPIKKKQTAPENRRGVLMYLVH